LVAKAAPGGLGRVEGAVVELEAEEEVGGIEVAVPVAVEVVGFAKVVDEGLEGIKFDGML
jgi:hypothetical protein